MNALDNLTPAGLCEIRQRDETALNRATDPAWSLSQAEFDRAALLAALDRLSDEHAKAAETAQHMAEAMVKVGMTLEHVFRTAIASGDAAGMSVLMDFMSDADMLPPAAEIAAQAGTETAA